VQRVIITRAPFRISFAGGGSDIPAYYREHGGAVLSATIDSYIYISIHPYFNSRQTLLKYSKTELVDDVADIRHPLMREAVRELCPEGGIEISSTADVPSGTGLGSSSSFSVALYQALHAYRRELCTKEQLAEEACELEIVKLGEPIGKQDQYAAAYGGLNVFAFRSDGSVTVEHQQLADETKRRLFECMLMFWTGQTRDASDILVEQQKNVDAERARLRAMRAQVDELQGVLHRGELDITELGRILDAGWRLKHDLASGISNDRIDRFYERALSAGALGGKLCGAGGGGFLLFVAEPVRHAAVRAALADLSELPLVPEVHGSHLVLPFHD
jgi:D-glycero-alpha-D-manno-heptose-7-phosphate kinase